MQTDIQFTEAALRHLQAMIARVPGGVGFRLALKDSGCSAYQYVPDIVTAVNTDDIHWQTDCGVAIYVEAASAAKLQGLVVDYVAKSVGCHQLVFNHPRAKDLCGCGESFNLDESS